MKIKITNKIRYTLILFGILILLSVGVYAVDKTNSWHTGNQIEITNAFCQLITGNDCGSVSELPSCSEGQILQWNGNWNCGTDNSAFHTTGILTNTGTEYEGFRLGHILRGAWIVYTNSEDRWVHLTKGNNQKTYANLALEDISISGNTFLEKFKNCETLSTDINGKIICGTN